MKNTRTVSAAEAVARIPSHSHVHLSSVASVPQVLVKALAERADAGDVEDLHFHHFHTEGDAPYSWPQYEGKFFEQGFFVAGNTRPSVNAGYADYTPVHLSETPRLYRSGAIDLGAALVQVSLPDANGCVSLGTSVDCSPAAIETARLVVGVVNPNVPFSYGNAVPLGAFDLLVEDDTPLIAASYHSPSETDLRVGRNCAELIGDGCCIQMGIGALPNAVATQLTGHRHLGLHTEMFADGIVDLIKAGVIDGSCKTLDRGKAVASFLLGSQDLYRFVHLNGGVLMKDIEYTNDLRTIAGIDNLVAINSATEVDLTGQICADSIGTRIYSGTGGQLDFVKGATLSRGGKSIIAFASRTSKGVSKICPILKPGAGVVTPRADAHWVVTEWGAVDLTGRSLQERARLLISIAHPDDREALERAAFERFGPHFLSCTLESFVKYQK